MYQFKFQRNTSLSCSSICVVYYYYSFLFMGSLLYEGVCFAVLFHIS